MAVTYAQNKEDLIISNYFDSYIGTLLDIGANNGLTFSNSRLLIQKGWRAELIEPSLAFKPLYSLYEGEKDIHCREFALSDKDYVGTFHEGSDSLLSGVVKGNSASYSDREVKYMTFANFMAISNFDIFDFITIDAETQDWNILKQIDLKAVGCKCLCVEYGSNMFEIREYCHSFGMKEIHRNGENLIMVL